MDSDDLELCELFEEDEQTLILGECLEETHMILFSTLLKKYHYSSQRSTLWNHKGSIKSVPPNKPHIQIVFIPPTFLGRVGHWVCLYYDTEEVSVYDSMGGGMEKVVKVYIKQLFPHIKVASVKFPRVQRQPNGKDCGVFAIAFAVSVLFGLKPETVKYNFHLMRQHLLGIFKSGVITHFPQVIDGSEFLVEGEPQHQNGKDEGSPEGQGGSGDATSTSCPMGTSPQDVKPNDSPSPCPSPCPTESPAEPPSVLSVSDTPCPSPKIKGFKRGKKILCKAASRFRRFVSGVWVCIKKGMC